MLGPHAHTGGKPLSSAWKTEGEGRICPTPTQASYPLGGVCQCQPWQSTGQSSLVHDGTRDGGRGAEGAKGKREYKYGGGHVAPSHLNTSSKSHSFLRIMIEQF